MSPRLLLVDVADDALPGALDAARVQVDLDESVDGVDGRVLIAHPGDVVRDAVGVLAGLVEANQRAPAPCAIDGVANGNASRR